MFVYVVVMSRDLCFGECVMGGNWVVLTVFVLHVCELKKVQPIVQLKSVQKSPLTSLPCHPCYCCVQSSVMSMYH